MLLLIEPRQALGCVPGLPHGCCPLSQAVGGDASFGNDVVLGSGPADTIRFNGEVQVRASLTAEDDVTVQGNTVVEGPSTFAYSLPEHSFHTRRDRVAAFDQHASLTWRGHTKRRTTRAGRALELAVRLG